MSNNQLMPFKCPHCLSESEQEKQGDGIVYCYKCSSTYLNDDSNDEDYYMSDDSFALLPPRDHDSDIYPQEESRDHTPIQPTERDAFSDDDEESIEPHTSIPPNKKSSKRKSTTKTTASKTVKKPKIQTAAKPKKKATAKSKEKTSAESKTNTKLPAIFEDDFLPNVNSKNVETYNDDQLEYSDLSDDDDDPEYIDKKPKNKNKRARERFRASPSPSSEEIEQDEHILTYAPGKPSPAPRTKRKEKETSTVPLRQYNPYIKFNQDKRGEIAKANEKILEDSSSPQRLLSQLVAEAWKDMSKDKKSEFSKEVAKQKVAIMSVARKKSSRPSGNGYLAFAKEALPNLKLEFPDIKSVRSLSSIMGIRWKGLDDEEKDIYKIRAKKERDAWIAKHPEEYQQYLDGMKSKIRATKSLRRQTRENKNNADKHEAWTSHK